MPRISHYTALIALCWQASRGWSVVALFGTVGAIAMPNLLIVASGLLVGTLPEVVRDGLSSPAGARVGWLLGLFGLALVGSAVTRFFNELAEARLGAGYVRAVEEALAAASLSPDRIEHLEDPEVVRKFAAATEASRENVHLRAVEYFLETIRTRGTGIVSACLLLAFHWWAPLLLAGGLVVLNLAFARWRGTAVRELLRATGTARRRAEYLRDLAMEPAAAKEIRLFGLGDWMIGQYAAEWRQAMADVWRNRRRSFRPMLLAIGVLVITNGVVLGVLGVEAYRGEVSAGEIAVFVQAIAAMEMLGILGDVTWMASRAARTAAYVRQLGRELASGPFEAPASSVRAADWSVSETNVRADSTNGPASISLRGLRFTYPGRENPVLDQLDLTVPAGQSLAVVGENGAGKSTLVKLLCGLYVPDAGQVLIDDLDLAHADLELARRRIGVVLQDFVRYELSLRDNVALGRPSAPRDQQVLADALADAGGGDLAAQVGWDTILSASYAGGTDLSGGQWQRVALARALTAMSDGAGVLVLDEPTAALDVRAEAELFERFLDVTAGFTTILISHRLSSVRRADRIVVLDDGRFVEDGTHEELIAAGGRYARMFSLQAQRFTDAESGDD